MLRHDERVEEMAFGTPPGFGDMTGMPTMPIKTCLCNDHNRANKIIFTHSKVCSLVAVSLIRRAKGDGVATVDLGTKLADGTKVHILPRLREERVQQR